jgi:hypothetical protein
MYGTADVTNTTYRSETAAMNTSNSTGVPAEVAELSPEDVLMRETADVPANTTGGSESAAMNTSENTHAGTEVVESSPDLSVDGSADETPAESETKTLEDTAEARIDFDDTGAPTPAEVEAAPGDTDGIQATESTNEASSASPVSEED